MSAEVFRALGPTQEPQSRCWKCLHNNGCCPWALPWWETIIDSIPGVGVIPSLIGWGCRSSKVEALDAQLFSPKMDARPEDSLQSLWLNGDRNEAFLEDDRTLAQVDEADTQNTDLWNKRNLIAAQRSNATALFLINFLGSIAIGVCYYTLRQYGRL